MNPNSSTIFSNGSRTYFFSSLFFEPKLRDQVTTLYAFVRVADNYVDLLPADKASFYQLKDFTLKLLINGIDENEPLEFHSRFNGFNFLPIVLNYVKLAKSNDFENDWTIAFLNAMEMDLEHQPCLTLGDTKHYMYGSAEVIGLMMAKLMNLPKESFDSAMLLGRAMQYINFIRDIAEDLELGRQYLPQTELNAVNLPDLTYKSVFNNLKGFKEYISHQLDRYSDWNNEASKGFSYLPKRCRIAVKTASDMYSWTAKEISNDPLIVYKKKVKPNRLRIIFKGINNLAY